MPNALAVVAHHDDHILWMGGTLLRTRLMGWNWTVIAVCVPLQERQKYFIECCTDMCVTPVALSFEDYQGEPEFSRNSRDKMRQQLLQATNEKVFDWVFTHGYPPAGEYGRHANHFEVLDAVRSLVQEGKLCPGMGRLAHFSYQLAGGAVMMRADAEYLLKLDYREIRRKCEWCMQAPDADTNLRNLGFPMPDPEAFQGKGLQLPVPFNRK